MKDKYPVKFLIAATILTAIFLPWASSHPDGLERVAEDLGFMDYETELYESAPIPDYDPMSDGSYAGSLISLLAGTAIMLIAAYPIATALKTKSQKSPKVIKENSPKDHHEP